MFGGGYIRDANLVTYLGGVGGGGGGLIYRGWGVA